MAMLLPEREIPLLKFWTSKKIDNYLQNIREKLFDKNMSHLGISIRKHYQYDHISCILLGNEV